MKKKHYFDVFPSEKHFEKQPLLRCQTGSYPKLYIITYLIDILKKKKFGWFTVLYLECSKYKFFSHSGSCFLLMLGINYKKWKKKHYFDVFPSEKHFEKQPLLRCQTGSYPKLYIITYLIDIFKKKKFGWFTVLYLECSKYKFFSHSGSCFSCCPNTLYPCKWWQKFKQHSSWRHQCQCFSSWRTDELPIGLWTRIVLWVGEKLYSTNQSMPKPLCWSYPWGTFVKSLSWICWWCFQVYMEFSSW